MDEGVERVQEGLQGPLEVLRDFGDLIPEPLSLDAARVHEEGAGADVFLAVAARQAMSAGG